MTNRNHELASGYTHWLVSFDGLPAMPSTREQTNRLMELFAQREAEAREAAARIAEEYGEDIAVSNGIAAAIRGSDD